MSGEDDQKPKEEKDDPVVSSMLKRSFDASLERHAHDDRRLLLGVQRKLRERSKGKFYADGWSTTQSRVSYALVAIIMLVVIVAVYLALGPMGISLH